MRYAFCTKTTYDPANGLDIKAFGSKTQYLMDPRVDIKVLSIADLATGTTLSFHGAAGARAAVNALLQAAANISAQADVLWISHTTFHLDALQAKLGWTLPGKLSLLDEMARVADPTRRSVAFQSLLDTYIPGADRYSCPLNEGQHTLEQLTAMNERDALLMAGLYLRISGEQQ